VSRRLDQRVAIVIGGAQGIGAAIARRFAAEGASLVIADASDAVGPALAATLGASTLFQQADVADPMAMDALAARTLDCFGRIDILVQNAGIYPPSLIGETSLEQWNQVLGVNLTGCFLATRSCIPAMRAQRHGRIVLMSSITGPRVSTPGMAAYSASKAGINGFIRAAALELAADGITVNGVEPGNIRTEGLLAGRSTGFVDAMTASIPLGRLGQPDDVASATLYLASDEAAYVTGTTIIVDGGQILSEGKDFVIAHPRRAITPIA
jgi:3-oxoacyl-[acyl-carrier protein] reductase